MLIKIAHPHPIKPSEITAEAIYADRRHVLRQNFLLKFRKVGGRS